MTTINQTKPSWQKRRQNPVPVPAFDKKKQENYERFMAALKEIHMI